MIAEVFYSLEDVLLVEHLNLYGTKPSAIQIAKGRGVSEVAAQFGMSMQSAYMWLRRHGDHGLEVLADRIPKPKSIQRQMPAHVEAVVLELPRESLLGQALSRLR